MSPSNTWRSAFRAATIRMMDIGAAAVPLPERAFDAVSIVDVLFHIVDDERYAQALANLSGLLKPGGTMILSENLVPRQSRAAHQVTRSRGWILSALAAAGLVVTHEYPMFFLMNTPVSSDRRLLHKWWELVMKVVPRHEAIGWAVGATVFPIETRVDTPRGRPALAVDDVGCLSPSVRLDESTNPHMMAAVERAGTVMTVVGARPNFMKTIPVIAALKRRTTSVRHTLVHTGQHYDDAMSRIFLRGARRRGP